MGKIYNPDDFLCKVCVYKSCLHSKKGRKIIKNAIKKIDKKKKEKIN